MDNYKGLVIVNLIAFLKLYLDENQRQKKQFKRNFCTDSD
ncbi:hypothetical protein W04_2961 [Pseudoalteromonas sp. SW0106-04]|nr:hypothetical protein W04_2961 [Pseudoalteromonas sp. SW0106-04]